MGRWRLMAGRRPAELGVAGSGQRVAADRQCNFALMGSLSRPLLLSVPVHKVEPAIHPSLPHSWALLWSWHHQRGQFLGTELTV